MAAAALIRVNRLRGRAAIVCYQAAKAKHSQEPSFGRITFWGCANDRRTPRSLRPGRTDTSLAAPHRGSWLDQPADSYDIRPVLFDRYQCARPALDEGRKGGGDVPKAPAHDLFSLLSRPWELTWRGPSRSGSASF